jgi:uncharacterized protein YgiM (DUF1202 family)
MNRKDSLLAVSLVLILAGCGGPGGGTPTPIPASVARPQQPTPVYPQKADVFSLSTPQATAQFVATESSAADIAAVETSANLERAAVRLFIENQTPAATGIASGGTAIYTEPGGRTLAAVPVGGVLTVTGKSADGTWYAVYNEDAVFGWVPVGQLRVYGADALVVVEQAPDPGPVATLLAQANQPIQVLDRLMAEMEAGTLARRPGENTVASTPAPTPLADADGGPTIPQATQTPVPGITGSVASDGRLNVRTAPSTAGTIVVKLEPEASVTVTGRTAMGDWLRVQLDDGAAGWAASEFLTLDQPIETVPVVESP